MADGHDDHEEFPEEDEEFPEDENTFDEPQEGTVSGEQDAVPTGFEVDEPEDEPQTFEAAEGTGESEPLDAGSNWSEAELDEDVPADEPPAEDTNPEIEADEVEGAPDEAQFDDPEAEFDQAEEVQREDQQFAPEQPTPEQESSETSPAGYEQPEVADAPPSETSPAGYDEAELPDEAVGAEFEEEQGEVAAESSVADENLDEASEGTEERVRTTEFVLEPELEALENPPEPQAVETEPLPQVGPYRDPATLSMYVDGELRGTFAVEVEKLVLGASAHDAVEGEAVDLETGETEGPDEPAPSPDIDLGDIVDDPEIWNRHVTIYRQNKNYTLFVNADAATQLNDELVHLGEHIELLDGDVLVLGGRVGFVFELPEKTDVAASPAEADLESEEPVSEPEFEEEDQLEEEFLEADEFSEEEFVEGEPLDEEDTDF